ncbi:ubiquitin carboxyl-terminal hydrolase isozyme L5-like [Anneissia japonica]|uniref:ubiquitin carboxyl-terminal hydrolase isozyme L5-like n=1 Tax=Anneissia japonica TaxID=1529436 RepID=UPI0014255ED5|nr:ubiquitin carboxyl-terminal hydrolase isozyme L5-like [Anneissia japonica]
MSAAAGDWCLIESDPGVFTELIKGFGTTGVQVEEIWSLDETSFANLKPVHGLIFLFKWKQGIEGSGSVVLDDRLNTIFFAKQVINNACATQAILSILLNCKHKDFNLGSTLTDFKEFSQTFDPTMKGLSISNSETIKEVHNSFSRQQMFEFDKSMSKDADAYHFVGFMPIDGRLYELDGLKDGPVDLGKCDQDDWLKTAKPAIEERISKYNADEIHFNLMAIVSDRKMVYTRELNKLTEKVQEIQDKSEAMETEDSEQTLNDLQAEISRLQDKIEEENKKMQRYKVENIRRKHNYLPLIMEMLRLLAKNNQLVPLVQKAKEKAALKEEAKKKESAK